jgi:2'-5' RNA ligase
MPVAVEMYFDSEADRRVRGIWAALDQRAVHSAGSAGVRGARPHVSLAVFDDGDPTQVERVLTEHRELYRGLTLPLASLGFFATDEAVAFLGVTPSQRLLEAHRATAVPLRDVVDGFWPYYEPDALVPHCTLASFVSDLSTVADVCAGAQLPILASVTSVGVVRVPSGEVLTQLDVAV